MESARKKIAFAVLLSVAVIFASCGRKAMDKAPLNPTTIEVSSPFYQEMVPGMEDGEMTLDLELPMTVSPAEVEVDSVYFQGFKGELRKTTTGDQTIYKTTFYSKSGLKAKAPIELGATEALIVYRYGSNRYLHKVEGIEQKEAVYAP